MKSVKIREIAEALRCVTLDFPDDGGLSGQHLTISQSEMLAELAIRAMMTPTEEMLRVGSGLFGDAKGDTEQVWEAMCQEALR